MIAFLDLSTDSLLEWLSDQGQPAYRAAQIRRWIFAGRATSFADMSDLPAPLRTALEAHFLLWTTRIARHQTSPDGTEKLLLELADGNSIECVLLRDGSRRTICVSSQVGCAMGCVFCASGLDGVKRNLTRGEILEQALQLQRLLPQNERLSHLVVMGMGEPLANLDHLLPALDVVLCQSLILGWLGSNEVSPQAAISWGFAALIPSHPTLILRVDAALERKTRGRHL
jgi:23S rRNA (adenine2503-C2)-methyltransferase